jgi:hypothetical protein
VSKTKSEHSDETQTANFIIKIAEEDKYVWDEIEITERNKHNYNQSTQNLFDTIS